MQETTEVANASLCRPTVHPYAGRLTYSFAATCLHSPSVSAGPSVRPSGRLSVCPPPPPHSSVNDVAAAIRTLVQKNESLGTTYNLAGPRVWTRKEVTEFVCHVTGREVAAVDLPTGLLKVRTRRSRCNGREEEEDNEEDGVVVVVMEGGAGVVVVVGGRRILRTSYS
jgi:hypothetical protein